MTVLKCAIAAVVYCAIAAVVPFVVWAQQPVQAVTGQAVLEFRDWLIIILQLVSLFTVIYSAIKIINRNTREWDVRELRLLSIEKELDEMRVAIRDFSGVPVKLNDIAGEIERLRNRLDRFLDIQGTKI